MTGANCKTVYVVTKGSGNSGAGTYHTDPECPYLERADTVAAKELVTLHKRREECAECAGAVERSGYDDSLYRQALAATPPAIE